MATTKRASVTSSPATAPRGTRAVMTAFTAALKDMPAKDRPAIRAAAIKNLTGKGGPKPARAPRAAKASAPVKGGTNRKTAAAVAGPPKKAATRATPTRRRATNGATSPSA